MGKHSIKEPNVRKPHTFCTHLDVDYSDHVVDRVSAGDRRHQPNCNKPPK